MDRSILPYRQKTELFLINEIGNVVVEDHGSYLMFPGGGIDAHEITDIKVSARRELLEETGLEPVDELVYLGSVARDWFPARANNPKRKKRYKKFRGEESHFFMGKVKETTHTKTEDDAREHSKGMSISTCIVKFLEYAKQDNPNTRAYREAQLKAIRNLGEVY